MLDHAFGTWHCHRVEFKTDSLNEQSRNGLLGIGAAFEGVFRNHMVTNTGRMRHSAYYAITDDDWPAVRERLVARIAAGGRRTIT
jgi:RimJ/RimL family protein N-acetyltransferase